MHKVYPDYSTPHPLFHHPFHKSLYSIHNLLCCLSRNPLSLTRIIYVARGLGIFSGAWGFLSGTQLKTLIAPQPPPPRILQFLIVYQRRGSWAGGGGCGKGDQEEGSLTLWLPLATLNCSKLEQRKGTWHQLCLGSLSSPLCLLIFFICLWSETEVICE